MYDTGNLFGQVYKEGVNFLTQKKKEVMDTTFLNKKINILFLNKKPKESTFSAILLPKMDYDIAH